MFVITKISLIFVVEFKNIFVAISFKRRIDGILHE